MNTLLAILCPPLAVLGAGSRADAAKNVILTALLYIPGVLHALRTVDLYETRKRYALVLDALATESA